MGYLVRELILSPQEVPRAALLRADRPWSRGQRPRDELDRADRMEAREISAHAAQGG